MNIAEDCLKYLNSANWDKLNYIISNNHNAKLLSESPTFSIFENFLIDELKRHEKERNEDSITVATLIFNYHTKIDLNFKLSDNIFKDLVRFLFSKNPEKIYAEHIKEEPEAKAYLEKIKSENEKKINREILGANLNIKSYKNGIVKFDKDIFNNSPQEKELYFAAKQILPNLILLPNTALSTIIDPKLCEILDDKTTKFFYKSTLDLCIVNPQNYKAEICIELDSSFHDKPKSIENDKMKDIIFEEAGLKLYRLRKKQNMEMIEIFKLFIQEIKNY